MKHNVVAAVFLAAVGLLICQAAAQAREAIISSQVYVQTFGAPKCPQPNPPVTSTYGITFVNSLEGTVSPVIGGVPYYITDPYGGYPGLAGQVYYSALVGQPGSPAQMVFDFATPQTSVSFVWGTPDNERAGNRITFALDGVPVVTITGKQFRTAFPLHNQPDGVNVTMTLLNGKTFNEIIMGSTVAAFEFGNLAAAQSTC